MPPAPQRQTRIAPRPPAPKARPAVIDRITPVGFADDDGIQILIYGKSGTGKTTLWSSFPGPILVMVCSGGQRPGELRSIDTAEMRGKVRQVIIEHSSEIRDVVDHVRSSGEYPTLVLDHVSGFADLILAEILGLTQLPAQRSWGMAQQQDYGQLGLQAKELLRLMLSVPKVNVVIVAQEREFNNDSGAELLAPFVGAALTPTLVGWLNTAVDYIVQTFIRQQYAVKQVTIGKGPQAKTVETREPIKGAVEYCLRTGPSPVYMTKFRQPKGSPLPDLIVDADYDKIMEVISAGR